MREKLRNLLMQWQNGHVDAQFVLETAEDLFDQIESDERIGPVEQEVVAQLSVLNQQLITTEDIPSLLELLATTPGNENESLRVWTNYIDSVNYESRSHQLKEPPYYQS